MLIRVTLKLMYGLWCALMWLLAGFRGVHYMKHLSLAAAVMTMSSIGALLAAVAIAFLLDRTGHAMSWFSNTYLLFGLYAAPACCAVLSTCLMAKKLFYKVLWNCLHFCCFLLSSAVCAVVVLSVCLSVCRTLYCVRMVSIAYCHVLNQELLTWSMHTPW